MTERSAIRGRSRWIRARPGALEAMRAAGVEDVSDLSAPNLGEGIKSCRSSWVRSFRIGTIVAYVKTYDYPTIADRCRGVGRTTLLAASRARREWDALTWLAARGFPAATPLLVGEVRWLGALRRAVLMTEDWGGQSLDRWLPILGSAELTALLAAAAAQIDRWHAAGFRDRNLDPRNILARRAGEGWVITKIDSPRYKLRRQGCSDDRLARDDWARLERGLLALGFEGSIRQKSAGVGSRCGAGPSSASMRPSR